MKILPLQAMDTWSAICAMYSCGLARGCGVGGDRDSTAGQRHLGELWRHHCTEDTWHLSFWRRKIDALVLLVGNATSYVPTWSSALLAIEKHCRYSLFKIEIRYHCWEVEIFLQGYFLVIFNFMTYEELVFMSTRDGFIQMNLIHPLLYIFNFLPHHDVSLYLMCIKFLRNLHSEWS